MSDTSAITLPDDLRPQDGRFGSGPSKVRPEQSERVAALGRSLLGTSHRQAPVRTVVRDIREGLSAFFALPTFCASVTVSTACFARSVPCTNPTGQP